MRKSVIHSGVNNFESEFEFENNWNNLNVLLKFYTSFLQKNTEHRTVLRPNDLVYARKILFTKT